MAWGVLEDTTTPRPPGTVLLDDIKQTATNATGGDFVKLKKDKHVVLQPQPSDSVNDPLNWPMKRKVTIIFTLITTSVAVGGMMAMLGTAGRILAERYHITYPELIQTLHPPAIATNAIALFFASAIAAVYGKRIGLVVGAFALWINIFSGYFANSIIYYRNLGIVGGVFGAPGELLIGPIITDLIFVHQRGRLMALSAIIGVIGGDASHVIAGNIISKLGIKYLYMISFAVMTPFLIAIYWFVWETTYDRSSPQVPPTDFEQNEARTSATIASWSDANPRSSLESKQDPRSSFDADSKIHDDSSSSKEMMIEATEANELATVPSLASFSPPTEGTPSDPKHTLRQNLRIYRGRISDRNIVKAFFQPFPFMLFPAVIFSTVINGAFITWSIMSGIISSQILLYPPYNLQPDVLAYLSLPGSAVSLIFAVVAGLFSDKLIQWMAHRNGGIYEPEYRLLLMIPAAFFSTLGFLLLGPLYAQKAAVWKLVLTSLVFHISGPFASSAAVTYVFDTMQNTTTEAFVATSLMKHIFVFFATSYVPSWFVRVGPINAYRILAILNLSFAALTIPMYMFGKRLRGAVSRNKFLSAATRITKSEQVKT